MSDVPEPSGTTRASGSTTFPTSSERPVALRRYPYPYRAMLAICSDLDGTPDRHVYLEIMRFLNTAETTSMGPGIALEVGNSIYFDKPPEQFSYWNTDEDGRVMLRELMRSGHVDCLHSYGPGAATRGHAARALDELANHDCRLEVWTDHARVPTNLGTDVTRGQGDVLGSPAYHADLTCGFGFQYVWRGRVTSVIGQDVSRGLGGLFTARHPYASIRTCAKEAAKGLLGHLGSARYRMHASNRVLRPCSLRDGTQVFEFMRCSPHWGGIGSNDTGGRIGHVLTDSMLRRLVCRGGVCILYTHLGVKIADPRTPFDTTAVAGFHRLAGAYNRGDILVTTTRRALGYGRAIDEANWMAESDDGETRIDLSAKSQYPGETGELAATDLDGMTFYVPDPAKTSIILDGRAVSALRRNPPDETGRPSVSIPWTKLEFPLR